MPPHLPHRSSTASYDERIIPIVIESTGQRAGRPQPPQRQESSSSAISTSGALASETMEHTIGEGHRRNHRFSDSMTSSTSSSGLGTDIHSLRHSLPSPVMEAATTIAPSQQLMSDNSSELAASQQPPPPPSSSSLSKQPSRKSKANKETSPPSLNSSKAKRSSSKRKKNAASTAPTGSVLDQMDVRKACLDMLVYTSSTEESKGNRGKELLRAGSVDALIVLATQSVKNDFLYQEAFMATYRTFISTHDLLEKLVQRFRKFNNRRDDRAQQQMAYKRVAHCAFSLMVRPIY